VKAMTVAAFVALLIGVPIILKKRHRLIVRTAEEAASDNPQRYDIDDFLTT